MVIMLTENKELSRGKAAVGVLMSSLKCQYHFLRTTLDSYSHNWLVLSGTQANSCVIYCCSLLYIATRKAVVRGTLVDRRYM